MDNSENKKSSEELADEALDKVAGGKVIAERPGYCPKCNSWYFRLEAIWSGVGYEYYCRTRTDTKLQY